MDALRRDMQEVVLVDADAPVAADGPAATSYPALSADDGAARADATGSRGRSARVRRWWPVALGLAIAVVAAATVADRRAQARAAALAAVPGVIAALDGPVAELWRTRLPGLLALDAAGGLLVGVERRTDDGIDILALDAQTGEARWRTPARGGGPRDGWARCVLTAPAGPAGAGSEPATVGCVVVDRTATTSETSSGALTYPTAARLVVLDATTGAVLRDGPTEPTSDIVAVGADLVRSHVDDDGRVAVTRTDAAGEDVRWTFASPHPLRLDEFGLRSARVYEVGDRVVVDAGPRWLLSGAGEVLRSWAGGPARPPQDRTIVAVADGRVAQSVPAADGGRSTEVLDPDTGRSFTVEGEPVEAVPDDGSLAALLVREPGSGDLRAFDPSGASRWTAAGTGDGGDGQAFVIAGQVTRIEGDALRAIDGRTGETVWVQSIERTDAKPLLTDGHVVLTLQPGGSGRGVSLAAFGLEDGAPRWRTPFPDRLYPFTLDGRLYGWTGESIVALG